MAEHLQDTLRTLRAAAGEHSCVAVGFSGGKDSLAVLDLAVKHFQKVAPYFYYFVPGLVSEESKTEIARTRYGLNVRKYPSPLGIAALKSGLFCDERAEFDILPNLTRRVLYDWIKADTGATLILDGEKKADGIFRRRRMANQKNTMADVMHPLADWLKWEVLSYVKAQGFAIPDAGRGDNGSVSLMDAEILFLHKHHPEDYEVLESYFPYIRCVVLREQWFPKAAE